MARPKGAENKDKPYRDALRRAIARAAADDYHALDRVAERHLAKAQEGDMSAIKELADRLDGKVAQAIIGGDENDAPIRMQLIERRIIDPGNSNSPSISTTTSTEPL